MNSSPGLRFFPYRPAAWLLVRGADAASYLQGQFSQDLREIHGGKVAYGLWLNGKGKIIADSFVGEGPEPGEFWVGSYFCPAAEVQRRLEEYIVADEVEVADATSEWQGLAVLGPGAGAWAAAAAAPGAVAFPGRRAAGEAWELLWPESASAAMGPRLGTIAAGGAGELERERIAAGIPAIPRDAGPADLPPEADLAAAAISYTKGCYTGQEVIARLKTRGRVRRRLRRVRGAGPAPAVPAPLWCGEKKAGELRSAVGAAAPGEFLGLAMVTADFPADAALGFAADADPAAAAVRFCV
jgi:hypothetical protein